MILSEHILTLLYTLALMADNMLVINARSPRLSEGDECRTSEGFQGQCVTLKTCPDLSKIYQDLQNNPVNAADLVAKLSRNICNAQSMLVCCKKLTGGVVWPDETDIRVPVKEVPECGKTTLIQKIVDGEDAQLFEWPWMARIMAKTSLGVLFTCGGALINDRYVLTAAHCTNKNPSNRNMDILYVRVGEFDLSQSPDCKGGTCAAQPRDAAVERIIVHPEYNKAALKCRYCHDIALIKLADPITPDIFGSFPICLPTNFEMQLKMKPTDLQKTNKIASMAGWGSINKNPFNFRRPNILQKAEMPFRLTAYCNDRLKSYQDPTSVFCAGDTGSNSPDSCRGDSGGPIMMKGKNGNNQNTWYVIGIVSRGPTICGTQGGQTIFTNVSYYLPWIQENMTP